MYIAFSAQVLNTLKSKTDLYFVLQQH